VQGFDGLIVSPLVASFDFRDIYRGQGAPVLLAGGTIRRVGFRLLAWQFGAMGGGCGPAPALVGRQYPGSRWRRLVSQEDIDEAGMKKRVCADAEANPSIFPGRRRAPPDD